MTLHDRAMVEIVDSDTGATLIPCVSVVPAFSIRGARGLLGRDGLEPGTGLLLSDPLGCIHTIGMRFSIDIVFLDGSLRVVRVARDVRPWRVRCCPRGRYQLELAAGTAEPRGLRCGRRVGLRLRGADDGGQASAESPHTGAGSGDAAHSADVSRCGAVRDLPSVPPPAGSASEIENHTGRRAPCARIC